MPSIIITAIICLTLLICLAGITQTVEKVAKLKYHRAVRRMEESRRL